MSWLLVCCIPVYTEWLSGFLDKVQLLEIFPSTDRYDRSEGKPTVARVYEGDGQLDMVLITTDVADTRGHSSKPIGTMIALSSDGAITGAKLVTHNEPIILISVPRPCAGKSVSNYVDLNFLKTPSKPGVALTDVISGVTVTLMMISDSVQWSIKATAHQYKLGTVDVAVSTALAEVSGVRQTATSQT